MKRALRFGVSYLPGGTYLHALYAQLAKGGYLNEMGWVKSFVKRRPVDRQGNPIPWITYSALSFLQPRITAEMTVFEYGAGNSTLWWASRVRQVISCEHDRKWFEMMKDLIPTNVTLVYRELDESGSYADEITRYGREFDVVVIDGGDRVNCMKAALSALKRNGVLILDNSDRHEYEDGVVFLKDRGYRSLDLFGLGPANAYGWCTSLFYKHDNCLGV